MSTSPLRIDRARATPAKPHLDKLPKFDHSLHFDPSLGVDDSIAREGSLETSSTATDVQNPLRQSISRDVSSSTSPTKRPSMLDITAPYTGEAPSQQDEEIFTAEQESDIVDYINEAQEQDEEADWPLYPSKVCTTSSLKSSNTDNVETGQPPGSLRHSPIFSSAYQAGRATRIQMPPYLHGQRHRASHRSAGVHSNLQSLPENPCNRRLILLSVRRNERLFRQREALRATARRIETRSVYAQARG